MGRPIHKSYAGRINIDMDTENKIAELEKRNKEAETGGGQKRIDDQHKKGKMTADRLPAG